MIVLSAPALLLAQFNPLPLNYAVSATGKGCAAINMSSSSYTDSFDSSKDSYSQTKQNTGGNVSVTGNITLSGSATINGTISAPNINVGACQNGTPGITLSGTAKATGGYVQLSAPLSFPNPPAVTPGSQDYTFSKSGSLSPGSYHNITVQGGSTLTLSPGTYNLNSVTLSGGSTLTFSGSGQVVVNLAGNGVSQPLNLGGGSMVNPSGVPANFQFIYGGTSKLTLSGGSSSYGVVYAPNAPVTLSGTSPWFGALVASTLTDSGGGPIHYDRDLSNLPPVANAGGPYAGNVGQSITFDGSKSSDPDGDTLTYAWNFGDGGTATGISPTHAYVAVGTYTVSLTVNDGRGATNTATTTAAIISGSPPPGISDFNPKSAPIGTVVNITGSNLAPASGGPQVTLNKQGGGSIAAPVSSFSATAISFVIPTGAASGPLTVTVGTQRTISTATLSIVASANFTLTVSPGTASVIQGESTVYAVALSSTNGFNQLATLSVSGLPAGITASFAPTQITAGQTSVLTVTAPASQALGSSTLSISASATVNGLPISQSVSATLQVQAVSTSFLGRTVVDDYLRTPIAGVTVKFLGVDGSGNTTGCSGQTVSDAAGNFSFTSLPSSCTGPQLIGYDGSTATSPPGKYAGVNLAYTLTSSQVTVSPVLIHLPRIDNGETVQVEQNAAADQTFTFKTIPGLVVTVYAGTTFTVDDGSQPNPFPLIALDVPVDRLPDVMPASGMLMPFIVAFQPANAMSNQPVAVNFPNTLNTPPGVHMTLMTLDPTRGFMVPYGTGTVSGDGMRITPDADPAFPGHAYGLVHFDWHGPTPPAPPGNNPSPGGGGSSCPFCPNGHSDPNLNSTDGFGDYPVDLASGLEALRKTDIGINGPRGSISIQRIYRAGSGNPGPFGIGTSHNYGYQLALFAFLQGQGVITLVMPDGNQFPFNLQADGTFTNSTIPSLRGAVMTSPAGSTTTLKWKTGTTYQFQTSALGGREAFLTAITDPNGNTISLVLNPSQPLQITQITDAVGRSLNLTYDGFNRITQISDPIGRTVQYTYNSQGTLATVTDPAGGVTSYSYDSNNNLTTVTDARGVTVAQNTYDANGRVVQQTRADGGAFAASYTLLNPATPSTSPVLSATVTDPQGNQSSHRFSATGLLTDLTDAAGQIRTTGGMRLTTTS